MAILSIRNENGEMQEVFCLRGEKGERGADGADGKNGVDGKDGAAGKDGYTPQKGVDYFDGQNGKDGKDGSNGADGKDGVSVTHSWNGTTLTVTSASGTSSADLKGEKGDKGDTGAQGERGETGAKGDKGDAGEKGEQGIQGVKGDKGDTGANGRDGYTPQRGVDYWTDTDQSAVINAVISHFAGQPIVGVVDSENNIILNGTLPLGTYTLKYEGADGEYSDIVDLTITEEDKLGYKNVLPLATDASGAVYNGVGYKDDCRISTSSFDKAETGVDSTGLIPIKAGDVLRFKNCNLMVSPANTSYSTTIYLYDSNKAYLASVSSPNLKLRFKAYEEDGTEYTSITVASSESWAQDDSKWAYIRFTTDGLSENSVITINQEIV